MRRTKLKITKNIDRSSFIDESLMDLATLWILRILIKLGKINELIEDHYVTQDDVLHFVDDKNIYDIDQDGKTNKAKLIPYLTKKLNTLEQQKSFSSAKILEKNIAQISSLIKLNSYEEQILRFTILVKQYEILSNAVGLLGSDLNTMQVKKALSAILSIKKEYIEAAFKSDSKLVKSSLVAIDKSFNNSLDKKLDSISDTFIDNMLSLDEDISAMLQESVRVCKKSKLKLKDYRHIKRDLDILLPYLKSVLASKQNGVNILFYGVPGTGKTELSRVLAKRLKARLFEVSYIDEDGDPIDGKNRLKGYKSAQALLASQQTLLVYDEAEDIFDSSDSFFMPKRQRDKAWLNKVLETNTIPTIWITNNIDSIDSAIVRRFDLSIEFPIAKRKQREDIIKKYSNNLLDKKTIKLLSKNSFVAPALISTSTKVVSKLNSKNSSKEFIRVINNILKAQGHQMIEENKIKKESSEDKIPDIYDPNYINSSEDLNEITKGIKRAKSARICLYGVPGTGKSAYAKYISKILNKPLLIRKGSDLLSKWVGQTEQNIANAFKEAKRKKAVLVFDEVDSFLQDRSSARASWEVTQVNEMLVQMESFNGVFIATTNLMDGLDKASLRRFDLKLEFGFLKSEQAWNMFQRFLKKLKLQDNKITRRDIYILRQLTPGDFAAVVRQDKFKPIKDSRDFYKRLQNEIKVKKIESRKTMGFVQ